MNLPQGTLLQGGKYRIVRFISSGGFGCTYEGELLLLHKRVAIKEFFVKDFCNRDEVTAQVTVGTQSQTRLVERLRGKFLEEASALFSMQHPNITRVTDVFEENGTAYYVMDFIDGESLHEMVKRRGALPEKEAVGYITQVADALRYVHAQNRLHLDIKPGNIMVDRSGKALLIDFGTSKQYDEEAGENTSTLMGKTPGYAPIEQMGNSVQNFTPATDIYSLGATLYKLLSGVTPPEATILVSDDEAMKPLPASVSPAVKKAVEWAMKVRRKERPQSIDEWSLSPSPSPVACARASSEGRGDCGLNEDDEATVFDAPVVKKEVETVVKKQAEEPAADAANGEQTGQRETAEKKKKKKKTLVKIALCMMPVAAIAILIIMLLPGEDANELFQKGKQSYEEKDYATALEYYTKAAKKGHVEAQLNLAEMYEDGDGMDENITEAIYWYKQAADQGSVDAQLYLAESYAEGDGVEKDYAEAIRYYKMAAEQGEVEAMMELADIYEEGEGMDKDLEEAFKWYKKAAEKENTYAQYEVGRMYENGTGVRKDHREAAYWYGKAAEQGNKTAKAALDRLRKAEAAAIYETVDSIAW